MPSGPSIFETTGAWEDYSTPARDFRLLIAIDVVRGFPEHVARRADRYAMPAGKSAADVKAELDSVLAAELAAHKFTYTRSDGTQWTLTLKDVIDREPDLEMAYNPNDCVELRWGAPAGSEEAVDMQAARAGGAARKDERIPHLVPRPALADARLAGAVYAAGRPRPPDNVGILSLRCPRGGSPVADLCLRRMTDLASRSTTWLPPTRTRSPATMPRCCAGAMEPQCRCPTARPTRHSRSYCGTPRSSISCASRIRAARLSSRRPLMPIPAASAIRPSSGRCTATAVSGEVTPHLVSLPWLPKTLGQIDPHHVGQWRR